MNADIIIVGAGPSGSTAALFLAKLGYKVLLIDKQEFPRSKVCGDAIAPATIDILRELGIIDQYSALNSHQINRFKIVSPAGNIWQSPLNPKAGYKMFNVVKRFDFDAFLLKEAQNKGVQFLKAKAVELIWENNQITGIRAIIDKALVDLKSKIVIGADGVFSTVARLLGLPLPNDSQRMIALRAYTKNISFTPNQVEIHFFKDIMPGYVWLFPLNEETVNVGLGMRLDFYKRKDKNLKQILDNFLNSFILEDRLLPPVALHELGGHLLHSTFTTKASRVFNGTLLIGDAGGWIDPLTGGGICNGMLSAKAVANAIHQAFQTGDYSRKALMVYEHECYLALGKELRRNLRLQKIFVNLPDMFLDKFVSFANNSKLFGMYLNRVYKDIDFN